VVAISAPLEKEEPDIDFTIIEREEEEVEEEEEAVDVPEEIDKIGALDDPARVAVATKKAPVPANLELEIKTPEAGEDNLGFGNDGDGARFAESLPDYEPTLDLRDYKYPTLDLLEAHGSEKIVSDAAELEANKNQIITTLKNYDIAIQKISATVVLRSPSTRSCRPPGPHFPDQEPGG